MADITRDQVRAQFPELGERPPQDLELPSSIRTLYPDFDDMVLGHVIDLAYQITDVSRDATLYCVGHLLAIKNEQTGAQDGGFGEVKREAQAGQDTIYMTQAKKARDVFFTTTAYGRMVLILEARSPACAISVVVA